MADKRGKPLKKKAPPRSANVPARLSANAAHEPVYFKQADGSIPGSDFLAASPNKPRAHMRAVIVAVAKAPPNKFSGGGYWEAMHGDMTGWFEVRVDGPKKQIHYRLFCRLDYDAIGTDKPYLAIITGLSKPVTTVFSDADYAAVRALGDEYFASNPRSIA